MSASNTSCHLDVFLDFPRCFIQFLPDKILLMISFETGLVEKAAGIAYSYY